MGERVHKSVMNIKVGMLFYVLSLFLAFFSRKIFLDCLGAEFIGLTNMLGNIMGFKNSNYILYCHNEFVPLHILTEISYGE